MAIEVHNQFQDLQSRVALLKLKVAEFKAIADKATAESLEKDRTIFQLNSELQAVNAALDFHNESQGFEAFAAKAGMPLNQHPLHYLFLNQKTDEARQIWKAAVAYITTKKGIR